MVIVRAASPIVTIYVRHAEGCKYEGDEFTKRCRCRKHFRWTRTASISPHGGYAFMGRGGRIKRLEHSSAARHPLRMNGRRCAAVEVFTQDKKNQDVTAKVLAKYKRELTRLESYCEGAASSWLAASRKNCSPAMPARGPTLPASSTRSRVRDACPRSCATAIKRSGCPESPSYRGQGGADAHNALTAEEYAKLLDTTYATFADEPGRGARVRALIQLMRYRA